jgi:hypothetical protein
MTLRPAGGQARAYQDAQRAYRAALARQQLLAQSANVTADRSGEVGVAVRDAALALSTAEVALRAHTPTYLELLNPQAYAVDLQAVLSDGEAYLRIVTGSHGGHGALVKNKRGAALQHRAHRRAGGRAGRSDPAHDADPRPGATRLRSRREHGALSAAARANRRQTGAGKGS